MLSEILDRLADLQIKHEDSPLLGNYPSTRYHRIFPLKREEDNVYFVAWIQQLLDRHYHSFTTANQAKIEQIRMLAYKAIDQYRNRYGEASYNFYRPKAWFPGGRLLSRFGRFQPTDDSDDTSIAYRGMAHSQDMAEAVKAMYIHQSNGMRDRWIKRIPKKYRRRKVYNTWIGSESLFIDIDLVVLSNILIFNASYDLAPHPLDRSSLDLIIDCVANGEHLKKKHELVAWYPIEAVILYSLADLVSFNYYPEAEHLRPMLSEQLKSISLDGATETDCLLIDNALMKLGEAPRFAPEIKDVDVYLDSSASFSFGVIPLLNPWDGRLMQYLSSFSLFRLYYDCPAQRLAILLEHAVLTRERKSRTS